MSFSVNDDKINTIIWFEVTRFKSLLVPQNFYFLIKKKAPSKWGLLKMFRKANRYFCKFLASILNVACGTSFSRSLFINLPVTLQIP